MKAICVDPKQIDEFWPHVEGLIIHGLSQGGDYTFEQIREGLESGRMLLWIACEDNKIFCCTVTALIVGTNPPEKRCEVLTIGGRDLPKWVRLIETVIDYARAEKCAAFRVTSRRKAWIRLLPDFDQPFVILEKRL